MLNSVIFVNMAALREIPDAINEYAAKSSMLCSIKPFERAYKRCGGGLHLIFPDNKMQQLTGLRQP
ncbi:MAG: hypothetical protein PHV07_06860 [Oscillospiraceae bacterium]|nr:hypothetical protein [Oscillospiraceae bacterium]